MQLFQVMVLLTTGYDYGYGYGHSELCEMIDIRTVTQSL